MVDPLSYMHSTATFVVGHRTVVGILIFIVIGVIAAMARRPTFEPQEVGDSHPKPTQDRGLNPSILWGLVGAFTILSPWVVGEISDMWNMVVQQIH